MRLSVVRTPIAAFLVFGLAGCGSDEPPRIAFTPSASYCYISLADTECYRAPIPGQSYRLVGTRPTAPR